MRRFSERQFEHLARTSPLEFISLLSNSILWPSDLTFALEVGGRILPRDLIVPSLIKSLNHFHPIVREGALLGLMYHWDKHLSATIQEIATNDASEAVRSVAQDLLDTHQPKI